MSAAPETKEMAIRLNQMLGLHEWRLLEDTGRECYFTAARWIIELEHKAAETARAEERAKLVQIIEAIRRVGVI